MKFYFCESCGRRITDADLDAGKGRDKKLKGVYCSECAKGVMTMEMMPLSDEQARQILSKTEPKPEDNAATDSPPKSSASTHSIPVTAPRAEGSPRGSADKTGKKSAATPVLVGVVAGLLGATVLLLFLLNTGEKPSAAATPPPTPPSIRPPPPPALLPPAKNALEKKTQTAPAAMKSADVPPVDPAHPPVSEVQDSEKTEAAKTDSDAKTTAGTAQTTEDPKVGTKPAKEGAGFTCELFEGERFEKLVLTRTVREAVVPLPGGTPQGLNSKDGISYRLSGYIEPPESGDYIFETKAKGKCNLYLNGIRIYTNYFGHDKESESVPVSLEAGKKYLYVAALFNKGGPLELSVSWRKAGGKSMPLDAMPPETKDQPPAVSDWCGGWKMEYGKFGSNEVLVSDNQAFIDWNYGTSAPGPGNGDNFWIHWTGLVTPPKTDDYTFFIDADEGAKVYVNDIMLIDTSCAMHGKFGTDPITLEEGKSYLVRVEYQDWDWVAHCRLHWSAPGMPEQIVRANLPKTPPTGVLPPIGFLAEYWNDGAAKPQVTRFERRAGTSWNGSSPDRAIKPDNFNCRYTGWLTPPADGEYTFMVKYDEGARLTIDDVVLFDYLNSASIRTDSTTIRLQGGKHYFLKLEHREIFWMALLDFKWKSADMSERYVNVLQPSVYKSRDKDYGHIDTGLLAEYSGGKSVVKRLEATLWDHFGAENGPDPSIPKDGWNGKWTGGMKVEISGNYVFKLHASNFGEMKLNKSLLVKGNDKGVESAPTPLQKGVVYPVEFTLVDRNWISLIQLYWKMPGKTEFEPVPPGTFVFPPEASAIVRKVP